MKEPYPSQKHHILTKLKMARSGQGWRRLKILLILLSAKIRSRSSSCQTFGVTKLGSPIISTSCSLTSIANMTPACQESGLRQGLSIPASSTLPSLVPSFASPSSSFLSPDPSWCFYFFLFFSFFTKGGHPLIHDRYWNRVQKDLLLLFFLFFILAFVICFLYRLV